MAEWSCGGLQIRLRRFNSDLSLIKKMKEESIILVSGGFDPVHIGHIDMFNEASKHGKVVVIANNNAVQIVLCIANSKAEAKETNLKYNTPITPHQREAPTVYNEPLNKFFFI